mmetsp:Transcript_19686/g.40124  ORF Transcript_19686/g.40124 Transcript_19686/m.40124 type:complete len:238 (-) Transcript_19686:313-1026(-)
MVALLALRDYVLAHVDRMLHHRLLQHRQLHLIEPREDDVLLDRAHDTPDGLRTFLSTLCNLPGRLIHSRLRSLSRLAKAAAAHLGRTPAPAGERKLLLASLPHERMQRHQLHEILLAESHARGGVACAARLRVHRALQQLDVAEVGMPSVLDRVEAGGGDGALPHEVETVVAGLIRLMNHVTRLVHGGLCSVGEHAHLVLIHVGKDGELGQEWEELATLLSDQITNRRCKRLPVDHQ